MGEAKHRPGAAWWSLQLFVGVCVLLPASWRLSDDHNRTIDWLLLVAGAGITINAAIWVGVSLAAGRRGWMHPPT